MNPTSITIGTIDWYVVLPVILVSIGGLIGLVIEMFRPDKDNGLIMGASLLSLAAAAFFCMRDFSAPLTETMNGMAYRDNFALVLQLLIIFISGFTVLFSESYLREKRIPFGEFYPMLLWSAAGAMIMVSTRSLLMLFVGLEVFSIALYVLAGLSKHEAKSEESAIKYFLLGALGSAFLLYGIAMIYGATGSLHLNAIAAAVENKQTLVQVPLIFGVALLLIGLCFKAALVPFHQWTPDVYEGAPTNVTGFMASASKVAAIGALVRVLEAAQGLAYIFVPALTVIAILTMVVGNVIALKQTNVKRMLGYSSISNAGYLLVGVIAYMVSFTVAQREHSTAAIVVYLIGYSAMTLGSFAALSTMARSNVEGTDLADIRGLYKREPFAGLMLGVMAAGLLGFPPLAGFFGKFFIFSAAMEVGLIALASVLAVTSVISIFYYVGIIKAAMVDEPVERPAPVNRLGGAARFVCAACLVVTIVVSGAYGSLHKLLEQDQAPQDTVITASREIR